MNLSRLLSEYNYQLNGLREKIASMCASFLRTHLSQALFEKDKKKKIELLVSKMQAIQVMLPSSNNTA